MSLETFMKKVGGRSSEIIVWKVIIVLPSHISVDANLYLLFYWGYFEGRGKIITAREASEKPRMF